MEAGLNIIDLLHARISQNFPNNSNLFLHYLTKISVLFFCFFSQICFTLSKNTLFYFLTTKYDNHFKIKINLCIWLKKNAVTAITSHFLYKPV